MPVNKCKGPRGGKGFKWGDSGKCYPTQTQAKRQGRAIESSKARVRAGR